ncbi:Rnf-Nqr domain containing protein [Collinsella intestinalis]|uniref:Rnf-Nqr domain containing protein n=1 Tax=Collinsella intestinalis TaxID=147207 RepID=UPI00195CCCB4|nr:Rnf-Nqr domain containing protein [Collinsella intestinalis]MBM6683191.1 hypothetical protein [Collinsella intestinalis]
MTFFNALFSAALDQNLVFCQLVGMVVVFLAAERPQDAFRLGGALWIACAAAGIIGWPVYTYVLEPWGVSYMASVVYLMVSCAVIFIIGAVAALRCPAERRASVLRTCALLAVSAAVLAVPLSMAASADVATFDVALGSAIGSGMGVFIAVVAFAFIHDRIDERLVPGVLRGVPISLITAALMALAFTGVAGIAGGLFV